MSRHGRHGMTEIGHSSRMPRRQFGDRVLSPHARDLEGCGVVRAGQRASQVVLRHREPRRVLPTGARQGRRPDQVPTGVLDRRRGGRVRRHRQGVRDRGRRDGDPLRRRHGRAAVHVVAGDCRREVRASRPDRPDAVREVLLPRAREDRGQALRAAAPGAARRRPDGGRHRGSAQPDQCGGAAGARRRDRAPDDDVARRGPAARLQHRDRRGQGRRGHDGQHARRDPRRRLRAQRVRGRLRRRGRGVGEGEDRGWRGQAHPHLDEVVGRGRRPARGAAAVRRRRQDCPRRGRRGGAEAGQEDPAKKSAAKKTARRSPRRRRAPPRSPRPRRRPGRRPASGFRSLRAAGGTELPG